MAGEHEIQALMKTAMESLREMVNVNTIVGDIIESDSGVAVIPVSRVCCGFIAGGGDCLPRKEHLPFMGGSGAGIHVQPVGFLVIHGESVRLIPVCGATPLDKAIEAVPLVMDQLQAFLERQESKR